MILTDEVRTMTIIQQIANSIDDSIKLTYDTPGKNASGKMPVLDIQVWLSPSNKVVFEFYRKPMANPYVILNRSAVSAGTKRSTLFQEAMRRLRNTHPDLEWEQKAHHLTFFDNQLRISGYSQAYRTQIIQGAISRYSTMLDQHNSGQKPLYRTRQAIVNQKASKAGKTAASWFVKDKVRQVINVPATPGSGLARSVQRALTGFKGPDKGETKVIESA